MKFNYIPLRYPFWILLTCTIAAFFTRYIQLPPAVINVNIMIHTVGSFVCVSLFMITFLWLSQHIGRLILFGDHMHLRPQLFLLHIFVRYLLYEGFLQYLLLNIQPKMDGVTSLQFMIFNIFAGLIISDLVIYWAQLKRGDMINIKLLGWNFQIMIIQVFRVQVFILVMLTFIVLCRYFVSCNIRVSQFYMPSAYIYDWKIG